MACNSTGNNFAVLHYCSENTFCNLIRSYPSLPISPLQGWLERAPGLDPVSHKATSWSLWDPQVQQRCQRDPWENPGMYKQDTCCLTKQGGVVEMVELPYSRKYWQSLNFGGLVCIEGTGWGQECYYMHYIITRCVQNNIAGFLIWRFQSRLPTAKYNFPSNFPAFQYAVFCLTMRCQLFTKVGKLFFEVKLVTDNLLFVLTAA